MKRSIIVLRRLYPRYCVNYPALFRIEKLLERSIFKGLEGFAILGELHLLICSPAHAAHFQAPEMAIFCSFLGFYRLSAKRCNAVIARVFSFSFLYPGYYLDVCRF